MSKAFRSIRAAIVCLVCIFSVMSFCGCSSLKPMALNKNPEELDLNKKSIGLFTLNFMNRYKPKYSPFAKSIEIISQDGKRVKYQGSTLCSVDLEPGVYTIGKVSGFATTALIYGQFNFDVGVTFELPPDTVAYLGHIDMVNRKKVKGEPSSGGIFPLIDQGVSGFAGGTFDITVSDRSDTDIPMFEETYPELEKYIVTANIMGK